MTGVFVQATYEDRPAFLSLWMEFMEEERKDGSPIHATTRNLLNYAGYFDAYMMGQNKGLCMFWKPQLLDPPVAVVLCGEEFKLGEWDTDRPNCAILWGVYVRPEFRGRNIGLGLELAGLPVGLKLGFHYIETMVRTTNKYGEINALAFGTEAVSQLHVADVREVAKELSHG